MIPVSNYTFLATIRLNKTHGVILAVLASGIISPSAFAACPVPNTMANGQIADASEVMDNFDALATCADAAVTPSGSPAAGQIATFSGPKAIAGGNLSGDITTSGSTATTLAATGVTPGTYTSANIAVDAKGRITAAANGTGGGTNIDIVMALGAAWVKEMVLNGPAITAGVTRSVKADRGGYVGMRMMANTNAGFASRAVSSVSYTVPVGALAFVIHGSFTDDQRTNTNFYHSRLYNVTQSRVAAGTTTNDANRTTPSQAPGTSGWALNLSGSLTTGIGSFSTSGVAAYFPLAGSAGDVLQLEAWTSGDGAYRMQDLAVYLVVVDATTGDPMP